ncbi:MULTISPECIES: dienelactone hydrolase family protein [Methylococcus]|jgi:dienelactone hydrolase|uniref:Carboxymethylenebutenolidase n=1 Tax=Methylococcus capsulatus TaxID=414 RepID=A0AA35V7Z0_METCP|nr:dienelactone hydrolase family protein [Methylococcus capsulatus]QXP91095.1 dienelactone hydrolase family protein [Methylococcus capsulatus]CAI8868797.1 carboxymethylenebutenolidase [Methylococcus capsulatus]
MAVQMREIDYHHADTLLSGYFACDDEFPLPRPGILVSHAWGGRDAFVCDKARRLAELGYAAFALDMYGKGIVGSGPEQNAQLMAPFMADRGLLQSRMNAALDTVRSLPEVDPGRIAAMGFCFGGLCVLDLARTGADLRGVVSFHGLFIPPGNTAGRKIRAKVLVLHGYEDPMAPPEQALALGRELTEAGADWQIHMYGHTLHAFSNPLANDRSFGTVYDPTADRRSWQAMQNFLAEVLN